MRAQTRDRVNAPERLQPHDAALQISLITHVRLYFPLRISFPH